MPDLGKFDVITSDLPFGMRISKDQDLEELYRCFVTYCEHALNPLGTLVVYTSEYELFEKVLKNSKFTVAKTVRLKIFVCKRTE